ncbi:site-specific integrase [Pseudomonas sp. RIT-PI-S]|uniref:site-specific integrase n=1 Tax=Pseudomonas sp. RIT-PI-S TaxID=3035295 RepID=UPI0021D954C7|nr:site-specific integrase [Pseudomonas sp. RIT-PI-S]
MYPPENEVYHRPMATIRKRKKKDGTAVYTVQIRIKRNGAVVYQECQTFNRLLAAKSWGARRESELAQPGGLALAQRGGQATLAEIIQRYLDEYERIRPLGKTKRATLIALKARWLGTLAETELTSQKLVEYAQWRMSAEGGGVQAQTVGNDLSHLGAVLSVAKPAWGYEIDPHAMTQARAVLRKLGMVSRSRERDRRPTREELEKLLEHFFGILERRPSASHMPRLLAFAIFSTRRQDEICRIRWDDLDEAGSRVLVRDMKNPGQKIGNNVWCHLPTEALQLILSMPRHCARIFPYNSDSVSTSWTRACKMVGVEDLRFHDLRHDGVSRLFEMDWDIPRVASVSGHRDWNSMRRYTHLRGRGDPYDGWNWLPKILASPVKLGSRR